MMSCRHSSRFPMSSPILPPVITMAFSISCRSAAPSIGLVRKEKTPVSYTHLDVYKRQGANHQPRKTDSTTSHQCRRLDHCRFSRHHWPPRLFSVAVQGVQPHRLPLPVLLGPHSENNLGGKGYLLLSILPTSALTAVSF